MAIQEAISNGPTPPEHVNIGRTSVTPSLPSSSLSDSPDQTKSNQLALHNKLLSPAKPKQPDILEIQPTKPEVSLLNLDPCVAKFENHNQTIENVLPKLAAENNHVEQNGKVCTLNIPENNKGGSQVDKTDSHKNNIEPAGNLRQRRLIPPKHRLIINLDDKNKFTEEVTV